LAVWIPHFEHDCSKMTDGQKLLYGCEQKTTFVWDVGEYKLNRCPNSSITDGRIFNYITAYNRYSKGFLPNEGGWMDQSYKFNSVLNIIEYEISKIEKLRHKSREKNR